MEFLEKWENRKMNVDYFNEKMDRPLDKHSVKSLTESLALKIGELDDNDGITLRQYRDLNDRWNDFQDNCKVELMRRVKEMLHKFARYGRPGLLAMMDLNDLGNVVIVSEKGIDGIFDGWDSYSFCTEDIMENELKYLSVILREYCRGECNECEYRFPLEFLEDDFDPMLHERCRSKILEHRTRCGYADLVPKSPTLAQMQRFIDECGKDENFRAKVDLIFGKAD